MTDEQHNNQEAEQKPDNGTSTTPTGEQEAEQKPNDGTSTTPTGEQEAEQKPNDGTSTTPTGEQEAEQKPNDGTSTTPTGEQEAEQKPNDGTSTTSDANQKKRSKTDDKGFGEGRFSSKGKSRNPFVSQETRQKDESKYSSQSSTKEKSKYSDLPTQLLQTWRERYETEIGSLEKQYKDLTEKINDFSEDKREANALSEERRIQRKLDRFREEREEKRLKLQQLEKDLDELNKELSERESEKGRYRKTRNGASQSNSSEEAENVTAQSLFTDGDPIKNIVLYVATFFPGLNPQDFKRVVLLLLEGKTKTIPVKESITTEEGKTQIKETQKEKLLTEIWQDSFDQPNKYLKECYLKFSSQNGEQGIYFTLPNLRKDFLTYFQKDESFYLEEQLRRTQKLDLLLDSSNEVAEKAMDVAVKAAIDYPNSYADDWLIELLVKIANGDKSRFSRLLIRLSNLIYRLQIESDYSRSEDIAQGFLEHLISPEYRSFAFVIVQDLMDKHLRSGVLGIQPAKQLLTWLRKLLDQESWEEKDEQLQSDIYSLLAKLLWQSGFYLYIYDFLSILKEWLPEQDISPTKYSPSNKTALGLLFAYCEETISIWQHNLNLYEEGPFAYFLFAPLNQDNSEISSDFGDELDILFSWLFYSDVNGEIAVSNIFNDVNLEKIGFFIAEWLVILLNFDAREAKEEVLDLVDNLIRHIISNTSRSQQNKLKESWTSLTEEYLDFATKYNESGNRKLKKQYADRRKKLRNFKKKFRDLQKIKASK